MFTKTQEIINATTDTYIGALRRLRAVLLEQVAQVDAQIEASTNFANANAPMPEGAPTIPTQGKQPHDDVRYPASPAESGTLIPAEGKDLKFIQKWAHDATGRPVAKQPNELADKLAESLGLPANGVEAQGA